MEKEYCGTCDTDAEIYPECGIEKTKNAHDIL